MSFFESEEKRELRRLKDQMRWEKFQEEQRLDHLRGEVERRRKETEEYSEAEHEYVQEELDNQRSEIDKIKEFLRKKFLEEWDSFEVQKE